jgi:hypothetical protein
MNDPKKNEVLRIKDEVEKQTGCKLLCLDMKRKQISVWSAGAKVSMFRANIHTPKL